MLNEELSADLRKAVSYCHLNHHLDSPMETYPKYILRLAGDACAAKLMLGFLA